MPRVLLLALLPFTALIAFSACESSPAMPTSESTPTVEPTLSALKQLAHQLSVPDHAFPHLDAEDIAYMELLDAQRSRTQWSSGFPQCYRDTLVPGVRYYTDLFELDSGEIKLNVPLGWTGSPSTVGVFGRMASVAESYKAETIILKMPHDCEGRSGESTVLDFVPNYATIIEIIAGVEEDVYDLTRETLDETWIPRFDTENIRIKSVNLNTEPKDGLGDVIRVIEDVEKNFRGLYAGNDDGPERRHYAFFKVGGVNYGVFTREFEGSLSHDAFESILNSMRITPAVD